MDNRTLGFDEIENRFGTRKASIEGSTTTKLQHAALRQEFKAFATYLDGLLPAGRTKALAMTELESASMWAHKAIAEQAPLDKD